MKAVPENAINPGKNHRLIDIKTETPRLGDELLHNGDWQPWPVGADRYFRKFYEGSVYRREVEEPYPEDAPVLNAYDHVRIVVDADDSNNARCGDFVQLLNRYSQRKWYCSNSRDEVIVLHDTDFVLAPLQYGEWVITNHEKVAGEVVGFHGDDSVILKIRGEPHAIKKQCLRRAAPAEIEAAQPKLEIGKAYPGNTRDSEGNAWYETFFVACKHPKLDALMVIDEKMRLLICNDRGQTLIDNDGTPMTEPLIDASRPIKDPDLSCFDVPEPRH